MAEMDSNCGNCKFYRPQQIMGICRFNPQQVNKHEKDWCGQHLIVESQEVTLRAKLERDQSSTAGEQNQSIMPGHTR